MFLRTRTTRGRTYLYVVENVRAGRKMEQRTLLHLGRRDTMDPALIRELATAMADGSAGIRRFVGTKIRGTPEPRRNPGVHLVEDQADLEESREE